MTDLQQYYGLYYFMGVVLDVKSIDDQLLASMPGVPEGYEILLEPVGEGRFRDIGGPVDGSTISFARGDGGKITGIQVGTFELAKISPDDLKTLPVVERLPAPSLALTPEKRVQFEKLLQTCLERADGGWIDYDLPHPKHEFVQYVTAQDQIIFHGSNNMTIDQFQPVRKSMELYDETGRGNVQAVYGTHDGLWAMFFAVVDREKHLGSIRNGVVYFQNRAGEQIAVYNFSINQEQLEARPYTEGALYFLPRETFTRLKLTPESYANEWASEQPVRPIAKLKIQPEEFPFLEQIDGHDDGELIRLNSMAGQIREAAVTALLEDDRFEVILPQDAEITASLQAYIELQRVMMPAAQFEVRTVDKSVKLIVTSLPPAVRQMLRERYRDLLA
jgi:hypothetical protein